MATFNRRQVLTALGMGGAASLFGIPLRSRADDTVPKRLLIISTNHGTVYDSWRLRPGNKSDSGTWSAPLSSMSKDEFSPILAPLYNHRSRLIIPDGLSMTSAEMDMAGYRHEKGWLHAWTGEWAYFTGNDLYASAPSLDQIVAAEINRPDRLVSLELSVESGTPISHAGQAYPLPREHEPKRVYERLFGRALSTDPLLGKHGSALDLAWAEYNALAPNLDGVDLDQLQTHFDLVRDLEARLTGMSSFDCSIPSAEEFETMRTYEADFERMTALIQVAFGCDLTRVISISMGEIPAADFGWSGYMSGNVHFDFAHRIYEDPSAMQAMIDYGIFHSRQIAALVDALASTPDVDGRSVMDNTLIVWGNELGDGWHSYHQWCPVLIGGDWYFEPGMYHHWPTGQSPVEMLTSTGMQRSGIPHHHLLVSVARAMGLDVDSIGLTSARSADGDTVDFRGEIAELRS